MALTSINPAEASLRHYALVPMAGGQKASISALCDAYSRDRERALQSQYPVEGPSFIRIRLGDDL